MFISLVPGSAWASDNNRAPEQRSANDLRPAQEIVVVGERLRGMTTGDVSPLVEIGEREIEAYAADSISDLLAALAPRTRGAEANGPIILVNGKRIANLAQVGDLPPEALLRVEILPEEASLLYGAGTDQRVVNLILRKNFRAVTTIGAAQRATSGGTGGIGGEFGVARIAGEGRWNAKAKYFRSDSLFEADRTVVNGEGTARTLLPGNEKFDLGGSWSGKMLKGVSFDLSAMVGSTSSQGRIGPSLTPSETGGRNFLANRRTGRTAGLSAGANGAIGAWSWFASATFDRAVEQTRIERKNSNAGVRWDQSRNRTTLLLGTAQFNGPLVAIPAGTIRANVELEGGRYILRSESMLGLAADTVRLSRSRAEGSASLSIPLTGARVLPSMGRLTAEIEGNIETLDDLPTIGGYGAGLRWSPIPGIRIGSFWSRKDGAPDITALGGSRVITPEVRIFDFLRGETVVAERLDGGNPSLSVERTKSMRFSLSIMPDALPDLLFNASYVRRRIDGLVLPLPAVSQELATAFPERFIRDGSGRLVRFDARPVNFDQSNLDRLNWTLTWSKQLAAQLREAGDLRAEIEDKIGAGPRAGTLLFTLDHRILLRNRLTPFANGPTIDFLKGAGGGAARHSVEFSARLLNNGLGANLDINWTSGYRATSSFGELRYRDLARFNLNLFANVGEVIAKGDRSHWSQRMRIAVEVDNLFNSRQRVVDQAGVTPVAFQHAYQDPVGRSIKLSIRKLF